MNAKFFYKTPNGELRQLAVTDAESLEEARQLVMQHLHHTQEHYKAPILGMVSGGKHA